MPDPGFSLQVKVLTLFKTLPLGSKAAIARDHRGAEAGSYSRLIDFVYHSTLGLKVIMKEKKTAAIGFERQLGFAQIRVLN